MNANINIDEVKAYNKSLQEYKDKANRIQAELEFSEKELKRQCEELSKELNIEVNIDNIEQILLDRIEKINNTMSIGKDILNRIRNEESNLSNTSSTGNKMNNTYNKPENNQNINNINSINNINTNNSSYSIGNMVKNTDENTRKTVALDSIQTVALSGINGNIEELMYEID